MRTAAVVFLLSVALGAAQRHKSTLTSESDFRNEAGRANVRGCANLTLVLDNWKYAIMTQVKDLLLHDHSTVLPDYGRIQPLSAALGDLYQEFKALKERLAELTGRFGGVEAFVEGSLHGEAGFGGRPQGRRRRVVVRRIQKPEQN